MILVDANLLIYAHNEASPEHPLARPWFERVLASSTRVGLPWPSTLAFVRIVSNPTIFRRPLEPATAWHYVREWLSHPNVWVPCPGAEHAEILGALLSDPRVTSRLVPDAHLAALAIEHGLTLCSTDADFGRFRGLRWEDPLRK